MKLLNYKIIWTVHNITPHEPQTSDDIAASRKLSSNADIKIVHSDYTLHKMNQLSIDTDRSIVIPHGNYIGTYPDVISRTEARNILNIDRREFVILFFGLVRAYKGVDDLLAEYKRLSKEHKNIRLVIAGECNDETIKAMIEKAQEHSKIDFYNKYIPSEEVSTYFNAANIVCLPFKNITTSGSTLLALSFGKALIAPRSGALSDIPANVGYLYDSDETNGLGKSLNDALSHKEHVEIMGIEAKKYAFTLSWDNISEQTYEVYERLEYDK